jgi:hypothetical protein
VAKSKGRRAGPPVDPAKIEAARALLANGKGIVGTAKAAGLGTSTVQKLKAAMAG